ncbi:MAG: arylesterase [Sphingomonadales bacterium]|nr:arylesterase [Sphingomonadales bacterium]
MKWKRARLVASGAMLALTACGKEAPQPQASAAVAEAHEPALPPVMGEEVKIVALGDSLFAGPGLDPGQNYPSRLEAALRARGVNARIMNAGVSGDTTADGLQRLDFTLNSLPKSPALVIISLGGNDMLRGLPPEQTRANLDAILERLGGRKVPTLLLGMVAAPNLGADYAKAFNPIYPALAKKHGAGLVPFFLQSVVGHPELVQADHIHPTAPGVELLVRDTVSQVVKELPATSTAPPSPH